MADQLLVDGRPALELCEACLHEALTEEYIPVYEPTVRGATPSAIIVGPPGLFVLHGVDWQGEVTPTQHGAWKELLPSGQEAHHPNPASDVRRTTQVLQTFFQDEFPDLQPAIYHFVVLLHPSARLGIYGSSDPPCVLAGNLGQEILAIPPGEHPLATPELRATLAVALAERQLTRRQRARQPFIFLSGRLGHGEKAHTIQQVIAHLDRYPQDGIYHLRNGSLEQWFRNQGAGHLATLARNVMYQNERDPRVSLEKFLLGTGYIPRPRLVISPRRVDLGYAPAGQKATCHLRLRRGRGRGYLFGTLEPGDPWLQVEPSEFTGSLEAVVTADTSTLLITGQPTHSRLIIRSSASGEPVEAPVLLRVMPTLSRFSRYFLRPLVALAVAGLLGASVGFALGAAAIEAPAWLSGLLQPPLPSQMIWAIVGGIFWAILGTVRGVAWNPAWPLGHGLRRWLTRTLLWGLTLAGVALAVPPLLDWLFPALSAGASPQVRASMVLFATTIAILPGTWGDMLSAEAQEATSTGILRSGTMRGLARGVAGVVAALALLGALRMAIPLWQLWDGDTHLAIAQEWASTQWERLEGSADTLRERYYLRRYDRRAPVLRATPTAVPPAPEEQAP